VKPHSAAKHSGQSPPWELLDRITGNERRETLELLYRWSRHRPGLLILVQLSIRAAISAVLGALESGSHLGPARIYIANPRRQHLRLLFQELSKINLAAETTLYHGSLRQFLRDLPLRADLICSDFGVLEPGSLRSVLPPDTAILRLDGSADARESSAVQGLLDCGILELEETSEGGAAYRTTSRCRGAGFTPSEDLRLKLRDQVQERCFLSEAAVDTGHTGMADATEDIRREFSRAFPGASGQGRWPHTAPEPEGLPPTLPSGKPWPKISIVTPTRNQAQYIEETILSVLHQNYPNTEYIIVDGASTDGTMSIVERYRNQLALVISEPDNGQSQAVNKGMSHATGDILTWLNSDDMLAPGALAAAALAFEMHPADMLAGVCQLYRDGRLVAQHLTSCADGPLPLKDLLDLEHGWNAGQFFHQPEVMFTRELWFRSGGHLDERLFYSLDYELWLRFARAGARLHVIARPLARYRIHDDQKTYALSSFLPELTACRDAFLKENSLVLEPQAISPREPQKLRVTMLNDHGGYYGAGIAHIRLARALAWAGHDVNVIAILDSPERGHAPPRYTAQGVLDRISASMPDLVIAGNLHNANADPLLLNLLAERFPTFLVMHDFWILTGRCAYTGNCQKYLTGCDETCPTPNDYPALAPAEIADAWLKKRLLLSQAARPALLANSEWTAAFARRALAAAGSAGREAPSIEVVRLSFPLDVFRPRNRRDAREQLGLPLDHFIVLVPASLDDYRKGGRAFLDALARLELPDLLVVVTGWPSDNVDYPFEVVQPGYISDPHKVALLNSAADVVVAPSSVETFGQVFIEAIACGTPVAGYPVAAVPESIRDGVTGLLASDDKPASLAAVVHHLYIHPELRHDLARWGRLYVENEWSEFSAYRHFFLALHRLGLIKSLGLRRKIGFLAEAPAIPLLQNVSTVCGSWRPRQGFSTVEQFLERDLPSFRWIYGHAALAEIFADAPGRYNLLIAYRNPHNNQRLRVRLNGALQGTYDLPNTGWDSGRVLVQELTLNCEQNLLHFELSKWYSTEENSRPLAILITDILVDKIGESDQSARLPTSQQAIAAAWGEAH